MIDLQEALRKLGFEKPRDFWFYDDCVISDEGISAKPLDHQIDESLEGDEWHTIKQFQKDILLDFPCSNEEFLEWCKRNQFEDKLKDSDLAPKEKVFYNNDEREEREAAVFRNGPPTTSLQYFIDCILTQAIGDNDLAFNTFIRLITTDGLIVYDKVIDGEPIPSSQLIETIQKRRKEDEEAFNDPNFIFWGTLKKERKYSIYRDNLAKAYRNAGQAKFPWINLDEALCWLDVYEKNSDGEASSKAQQFSKKKRKSFQQEKWETIPEVNQSYWKHKDTLTLLELAFILKGKEPQSKDSNNIVRSSYPPCFYQFFIQLTELAKSSIESGKLKEINPPIMYCEEYAGPQKFEQDILISWAAKKGYEIPDWLMCKEIVVDEATHNGAALKTTTERKKMEVDGVSKTRFNDIEITSLLNAPSRQDAWFDLIADMTQMFYEEFEKLPNETQAWGRLCKKPPPGYEISTGKDKGGEDCLDMPGEKTLSKSAFSKRWNKYIDNKH